VFRPIERQRQGRRHGKPAIVAAVCLLTLAACRWAEEPGLANPIKSLAEVWRLTPAQARRGYPVEFHGVVTFFDPQVDLLTIQDGTAGIYVQVTDAAGDLRAGQAVDVRGFTGYEANSPVIVKPVLKVGAIGPLPAPRRPDPGFILAGQADYQRIETNGKLLARRASDSTHVRFKLQLGGRAVECILLTDSRAALDSLVGKDVAVRGVPVAVRAVSGEIQRVQIYLAAEDDVESRATATPSSVAGQTPPESAQATPGLPVLTTAAQVKSRTRRDDNRFYPIRLRAVVTLAEPDWSGITVQDSTAGIYVAIADGHIADLKLGDVVEIAGFSIDGQFAPSIVSHSIRVVGHGPLPAARPFWTSRVTGPDENARTRVSGVVQSISKWGIAGLTLSVAGDSGLVPVRIVQADAKGPVEELIDAEITADGVGSPIFDREHRIFGFQVVAQTLDDVKVTRRSPGDRFAGPAVPIQSILRFNPDRPMNHRIKVAGTVVLTRNEMVYVADDTGGVQLLTHETPEVRVGDRVEAVGFPPVPLHRVALEDALLRRLGPGRIPAAVDISGDEATGGPYDARLVRLTASLINQHVSFGDHRLYLQAGRKQFAAILEYPQSSEFLESLQDGSLLQITGVCVVDWDDTQAIPIPRSFHLLIPSLAGIQVLHRASWWTLGRALIILGLMSAVVLAVLSWVVVLRRRVASQTAQIRERMEHEVRLQRRLEEAQRLESLGRLAGGIAHDFNNLLTVINGYADLLLMRAGLSESNKKSVIEIRDAGKKAASLTLQLLAFSRKQVLQPRVLDLNSVALETEAILRRLIGENIHLDVNLDPSACMALADPGLIMQVLMNLAVNARDAMPGGGTLTISTTQADLNGHSSGSDWRPAGPGGGPAPGSYVLLSVIDTGAGMDEATRAHIFEPFFTTKEVGKGTGLGLSTVFGIVRQSKGYIRVQSEPGKGSAFTICLPRVQAGVECGAEETPQTDAPSARGRERILIVEDQAEVRSLVRRVLQQWGYVTLEASGAEESLALLSRHSDPIELMITDVVMPGMTGVRLADVVKRIRPEIKVLFMSGYTNSEIDHEGLLHAGVEFIQKPFTPDALVAKVRAVLA
jgi:signal transduction histidine kinase/CheY-like chemotaxis protein